MTLSEPLKTHLRTTEWRFKLVAPRVIREALTVLAGDEEIRAAHCDVADENGATTWRAVWVTATRVLYAEASKEGKEIDQWTAYADDQEPSRSLAWARPLSTVAVSGLRDLRPRPTYDGAGGVAWVYRQVITFEDGTALQLPFTGELPKSGEHERTAREAAVAISAAMAG